MGPSVLFHGEQTDPHHPARISDDHLAVMKVFKDLLTGDEMFTDTYKYEEAVEGTDSNTRSGIDVVLYMRLQETSFGAKKEYLLYLKDYIKSLKTKLEDTPQASNASKLPAIQKPLGLLLKNFKDLQFFAGESMNPDGMIAILDYKEIDGEERPVIYFPKYGLEEEKL